MAFDFYFAGTQHIQTLDLQLELNTNQLKSYVNDLETIKYLAKRKRDGTWKGKLMIDSGAFTLFKQGGSVWVDEYIQFLNSYDDVIDYCIQLDSIPGKWGGTPTAEDVKNSTIKTFENYEYMITKLNSPDKLLPVFHQHEDFSFLRKYLDFEYNGKKIGYMCISGDKQKASKFRKDWYTKVFSIIRNSNNPKIKTHCLGSATISDMEDYPFNSSDATTWLMASSNGSILLQDGAVLVSIEKEHDKKHINNLSLTLKTTIQNLCKKYSLTYELLLTDYKERSNFNTHILTELSSLTNYKFINLHAKKLF